MRTPEPRLITVIRRLADLEAGAFLTPSQIRELNALRIELGDKWPEVGVAIASAYLRDDSGQVTP